MKLRQTATHMLVQDEKNLNRSDAAVCAESFGFPLPEKGERPTAYADRVGLWCVSQKPPEERKRNGLYLTPVPGADFMGSRPTVSGRRLRILDPAAGAGVLSCAAAESLVSRSSIPEELVVVAYEIDSQLVPALRAVLDYLGTWCAKEHSVHIEAIVEESDFVLAHAHVLQAASAGVSCGNDDQRFDVVICNPPYFKIGAADLRAVAASCVVHGQPNIYGLFMAVGAALLKPHGDLIYIVPRSFVSGSYFRRFRAVFFTMVRPTAVHVFRSRRAAFPRDQILQESIIFCGSREEQWGSRDPRTTIVLSSSNGVCDIGERRHREVPLHKALDLRSPNKSFRLPASHEEEAVLNLVDSWSTTLDDLDLTISTGPVVPFRTSDLIDQTGHVPQTHVPLLWMAHVQPLDLSWPLDGRKRDRLRQSGSNSLVVPNHNYVLLRRFSVQKHSRRLTAAPYIATMFDTPGVGIENHINYVHRLGGTLTEDEAWGLAALYSSRLMSTFFAAAGGNTQVSAYEVRAVPLPDHGRIIDIGRCIRHLTQPMRQLDAIVMASLVGRDNQSAVVDVR